MTTSKTLFTLALATALLALAAACGGRGDGGSASPGSPLASDRSQLLVAAVDQLVRVDNSFDGGAPFERIEIQTVIGETGGAPLTEDELDSIAAAIDDVATVTFVVDAEEAIDSHLDASVTVAVVSVADLRIDGDKAQVDVGLWCGNLCGIWLTYDAELEGGMWRILGPAGPIAIS